MLRDFKPLNPWGRPMPKPQREMQKAPPSLFQVHVEENATGRQIPVGPKVSDPVFAERFCEAIGVMIGRQREKSWSNPVIVEFKPQAH